MTRAGLVQASAAAAGALALPSAGRSFGPLLRSVLGGVASSDTAVYLRRATYLPLVGEAFEVARRDGGPVQLRLVEVRALASTGEAFSLVFQGASGTVLESAVHRVEHPALGAIDLFLGPVGRPAGRAEFEAVVNRTRRY